MLFVGTSIIHPSTEGVFLLCNILDLLIYSSKKLLWGRTYFNVFYFGGIMYNGNETSVTNYDMGKGRENNET